MSRLRAHLAAIRGSHPSADSVESVDRLPGALSRGAIGTNGTIGKGMEGVEKLSADPIAARVAFYLTAMAEAAEALATPDPDLDAERAVMAEHYAAPASTLNGEHDDGRR